MNFVTFLRTTFLKEHLRWLLLKLNGKICSLTYSIKPCFTVSHKHLEKHFESVTDLKLNNLELLSNVLLKDTIVTLTKKSI